MNTTRPDVTKWKAEYLRTGGPDPRQHPGWYATRMSCDPKDCPKGHGIICSFRGPFDDEAAARAWCDAANAQATPPPASAGVARVTPTYQ